MVMKAPFKNEHIEAFRAGRYDDIPAEALAALKAVYEVAGKEVAVHVVVGNEEKRVDSLKTTIGEILGEEEFAKIVGDLVEEK